MSEPTAAQKSAIAARGNILVVAGAGAGKTRTLIERCLAWLREDKTNSLDQILMVTFTEAAAAGMRERLRKSLEAISAPEPPSPEIAEQLAFLETAHICTLHSFCLRLVRQHFYELGLDPALLVLADDQSRQLARKALDAVLDEHYRGETEIAAAVQNLIHDQGRGWDQPVRDLICRIHAYTQTLPDPEAWFSDQVQRLCQEEPSLWREWLIDELKQWRARWLPMLQALAADNPNARQCAEALEDLPSEPSRQEYADALARILDVDKEWPAKQKTRLRPPIEKVFQEAAFLHSITAVKDADPLAEDWQWVRPQMRALLELARQFESAFSQSKREIGGVDFHDLEQFSLRLLQDPKTKRPTTIAEHWRKKFQLIFVDEYQDINAAQDAIIQALGGEGNEANRFLVGDIKQSIYRFRLANPKIFLDYQKLWSDRACKSFGSAQETVTTGGNAGRVILLAENFRSHQAILNFVNAVFGVLMKQEVGGIAYDEAAHLHFGNREGRAALAVQPECGAQPKQVELHVRAAQGRGASETHSSPDWESMSEAEKEAQLVGKRLLELKQENVFEGDTQRAATWSDMVILLRSPRKKVECYVKEFSRLGIPLAATRGGFYESLEISDLLALLQLLDNPLQDYPLLAVLRSPLAGLTVNELAAIRVCNRQGRFWTALVRWHETEKGRTLNPGEQANPAYDRVDAFLRRFRTWRGLTRHLSISRCLEIVLEETHYADWLLTQDRGEQRRANVERLLQLTRQFDVFQREGLYRFLKFVEVQQENEIEAEPAATPVKDAVRLMSIHQSKGLEFPIVVVADLGKTFNLGDVRGRIILDEELGLCPQVKPPQARQFYPSLPYWMAQRRQKNETLGEELRLLYVALTRAAERLVLVGTARSRSAMERWLRAAEKGCGTPEVLGAGSFLDWLGAWLVHSNGISELAPSGSNSLLEWQIYDEAEVSVQKEIEPASSGVFADVPGAGTQQHPDGAMIALQRRLEWRYPYEAATRKPAKTSVSALRREMIDEEAKPLFDAPDFARVAVKRDRQLSAAERGSAHHRFLELASLERVQTVADLQSEAQRLCLQQRLTAQQTACLDFESLAQFWHSEVGRAFLQHTDCIRRELAFTARFTTTDFPEIANAGGIVEGEFVVVQGVIDLALILLNEIWLLDFKTDFVTADSIAEKVCLYQPQLRLYGQAITRIYGRPVTNSWLHFLAARQTVSLTG